ncbi:MAG: PLP-dependent aspartate aminotransferase family protein [Bryobacteraceae bacterium]
MKIESKAVHAGDRRKAGPYIPVTTPIYTAASYYYDDIETLDGVFAGTTAGYAYARYANPTTAAFEELVNALENGCGALACSSGMAALQMAIAAATSGRAQSVLAAEALYGATIKLLLNVLQPTGAAVRFVDMFDLAAVEAALAEFRPGCVLVESISNPLLRVPQLDRLAALCGRAGVPLIVDNTFATPLLLRPLELGAQFSVHSATKYLAGHGDVLGGVIVTDEAHLEPLRTLARVVGANLGPFESYLAMRGAKTLAVRFERQCSNAARLAEWLAAHPAVERVFFPARPDHPDREAIARLLPAGLSGAMVAFELRGADRAGVMRFLNALEMIVPATSLGDVHSMILYPFMSSHRDVSPELRERMGIRENLVRMSAGIEAAEDILADLDQAFRQI